MPPAPKPTGRTFRAPLERGDKRLGWVIVCIPFDVQAIWKARGPLQARGEINGFPFRTSLFPTGAGEHILLVNKRMQTGAKAGIGTLAQFRLEPDTEVRT